jgi:hypothetical protein
MFNKNIHSIAVKNYYTNPVGEPRFDNPYLLMSQNQVLNQLAINKHLLDKHRPQIQSPAIPTAPKIQMTVDQEEDLARHVMMEVYEDPKDRREIDGFRLSTSLSSDEHAVYVGKNNILFGLRGSSVPKDFIADAEIGLKNVIGYPDELSETLNNRYARDEAMYNRIRAQYPNKHIIMGGHSLGNTLGMNILKNHKDDQNIKFFGYNGWIHPDYNKDRRAFHTRQEGDLVSSFTPTDSTIDLDPSTRIGVGGVGVVGSLGYIGQQRARDALATSRTALSDRLDTLMRRANLNLDNKAGNQVTRAQIEEAFPEYTNVRTVLENSDNSEYEELLNTSGFDNGLYIKTEDAEAFSDFLFSQSFITDANEMDWTDLHEAVREFNSGVDLAAHPELTDATDYADATDMIDPFYYPHNVYVTDGDDGLQELNTFSDEMEGISNRGIEEALNPLNHSGIMDQSRLTSSEILDTPGAIQIKTGTEVLEDTSLEADLPALELMVTEGGAALETAMAVGIGATGVAALAAGAYWLWSHSAKRFKLKNNRFRNKPN